jgi:transposase
VYWKPVWHVLEELFAMVLANAMHIHNVPGCKSDTNNTGVSRGSVGTRLDPREHCPTRPDSRTAASDGDRQTTGGELARHILPKALKDANWPSADPRNLAARRLAGKDITASVKHSTKVS